MGSPSLECSAITRQRQWCTGIRGTSLMASRSKSTTHKAKKPAAKPRKRPPPGGQGRCRRAEPCREGRQGRPHGAPFQGCGDLRGRLCLRAGTARLPAGRGLRARGPVRSPRGRRAAAPGLRACRLRCHPGAHLLRAPGEASGHRPGEGPRAYEPRGPLDREVRGAQTGTLFAGDLCNTNIFDPGSRTAIREVERIFAEQVGWAVDAGVDYFVAETFSWGAEALLALKAIRATPRCRRWSRWPCTARI